MIRILIAYIALVCCGIDFVKELLFNKEERKLILQTNSGLSWSIMKDAYDRVKKRPWSITHDWVNVITTWMEGPHQRLPARMIGLMFILNSILFYFIGGI